MDRIDIVCDVVRPSSTKVIEGDRGLTSKEMRQLVISGREYRRWREEQQSKGDQRSVFEEGAQRLFERYARGLSLGGRSIARVSRVARTVADLEHHELSFTDFKVVDIWQRDGYLRAEMPTTQNVLKTYILHRKFYMA